MEFWKVGVMDFTQYSSTPLLHHSNIPSREVSNEAQH